MSFLAGGAFLLIGICFGFVGLFFAKNAIAWPGQPAGAVDYVVAVFELCGFGGIGILCAYLGVSIMLGYS